MIQDSSESLLQAFQTFSNLFTNMWFWKMDGQFNVIQSNCPHESLFQSLFLKDGRREAIEAHMAQSDKPVCYTVSSQLSWVMAFGLHEDTIDAIYIVGPFFTGTNDSNLYSTYLASMNLSKEAEDTLKDGLSRLPILRHTEISMNAVLLHFCVRGERLDSSEIVHYVTETLKPKPRGKVETNQFEKSSGRWAMEQELLNRIRSGDQAAAEVLSEGKLSHTIAAFGGGMTLSSIRSNIHQLLTLVSRASVEGGLPQRTAFSLCSEFRERVEHCRQASELEAVSVEIVREYAARVHNMKQLAHCSAQIRLCCEYIDTHPEEKITLEDMAQRAGYSPYHLSRKFNQELNCSIIEYIQNSKIERGKYLLIHSEESVDDISCELGFNSRSYFTTVFKSRTGMTPSEYRKQYVRI